MGKRFLIGQLGCYGDCLIATTLAKQIKHDYPESHLTWAISSKFKSILEQNPYVDKIWEIPYENIIGKDWNYFEKEAEIARENGAYDEIFYTQVHLKNLKDFFFTLRKTVLGIYKKPITVDISPVVRLSKTEVDKVSNFAERNHLNKFKQVILFECSPNSNQSKLNADIAIQVAETITKNRKDVCFILSTPQKLPFSSPQIVDASELTFRENAELTKYCDLLVGCGSGISWISTSDWAKKLPMLQLLDAESATFAGIHYDFELHNLDTNHILEMLEYDEERIVQCLESILGLGIKKTKPKFHQKYRPNYYNLKAAIELFSLHQKNPLRIFLFARKYIRENKKLGNQISGAYLRLIIRLFYFYTVRNSEKGFFFQLRKFFKFILWKKSHS
ncbi:MAG: hypothetical protein K1X72_09430 [Pyrinomonadaceae bacterium]|nr:hypothetical protein [Pyrinomonadaceae bacterium]